MSRLRVMLRPLVRKLRSIRARLARPSLERGQWSMVRQLRIFDANWYALANRDVAAAGVDPLAHYMTHGWREGRMPSPLIGRIRSIGPLASVDCRRSNPLLEILRLVQHGQVTDAELEPLRASFSARQRRLSRADRPGVLLHGYFSSEIGLGQAARLISCAMDMARVPMSMRDMPVPDRDAEQGFVTKTDFAGGRRVDVIVLGMDVVSARRWPPMEGSAKVLIPFWELARFPEQWHRAIRDFDAVWAPSGIVRGALNSMGIDAPLIRQPVIVPVGSRIVPIRAATEPLQVLTYLDFDSFLARKNVRAAVNAFRAAFAPGHPASMTVKVRGTAGDADRAWLAAQMVRDRRIRVIDATLQWREVDELVRQCDVFVSLHRSEGFGFGAAEALAHGKAVVSTDYGGTVDFISERTGYPVSHRLVPVRRGEYLGWEGQEWADPSVDHAAELLRAIDRDRGAAAERGRAGRQWMIEHHAPAAVGRVIREWLAGRGWL